MPRRYRPDKRVADPDPKYNDRQVQSFINRVMKDGKKSTATSVVYDAFDLMEQKAGKPGLEVFKAAMKEVSPVMEVRPRRVGGATYQVPMEVRSERALDLAMRWMIGFSRARKGKAMYRRLAEEFISACNNEGSAVKKREDTHKMAEANKAFAHYRW